MRYEEYRDDKHECRKAAMEIESKEGNLTTQSLQEIQMILPMQTVAFGCHTHICRGKTDGREDLLRLIVRLWGRFFVDLRVPLEGHQISSLTRTKVNIKRLFRDIKHKIQND